MRLDLHFDTLEEEIEYAIKNYEIKEVVIAILEHLLRGVKSNNPYGNEVLRQSVPTIGQEATKAPRINADLDRINVPESPRSEPEQAKICLPAYCGECCDKICELSHYQKATESPRIDDLPNIPDCPPKCQEEHIKAIVASYLSFGIPYDQILWDLEHFYDISLSPAGLAEVLEELA